jgi:L-ribulose-5-phosphate 3-epimerase
MSLRLAVCSWSLRPANPQDLIAQLQAVGISRVQLALGPLLDYPSVWNGAATLFHRNGIDIVSGMFDCVGEDYTTLETIRVTGGIAPDATWEQNWARIRTRAALARELGLNLVTFHAGFLPREASDPKYPILRQRLRQVADLFAAHGTALALETGQESAATLLRLLQQLDRPNVGVNFDPANMILYGQGDPIAALQLLAPWMRQVHVKDARHAEVAGTWGTEVPVGTGDVGWPDFLGRLRAMGFAGDYCIEREAGDQQLAEIRATRELLERTAA